MWPWPKLLNGSILQKFLLEIQLKSESFELLMTFWGFGFKVMTQKQHINELIP